MQVQQATTQWPQHTTHTPGQLCSELQLCSCDPASAAPVHMLWWLGPEVALTASLLHTCRAQAEQHNVRTHSSVRASHLTTPQQLDCTARLRHHLPAQLL